MSETIVFLGWTDEVTACDLCGKKDLKSTAALDLDGETVFYGCVCAARALAGRGVKFTAAKIRRETERAHEEQIACGKAFDQGLNWRALEAEANERLAFETFVRDHARKHLDAEFEALRITSSEYNFNASFSGLYVYGIHRVFGGYPRARAAFDARKDQS